MQLDRLLDRCRDLEGRAATIYRSYAAGARARRDPTLCALWTALAREEEEHTRSLEQVRMHVTGPEGWRTQVEGWDEALSEVETRVAAAEQLTPTASADTQLGAALDLELSEIDALRHLLLAVGGASEPYAERRERHQAAHAIRLAQAATQCSEDPHVRLQAALLLARAELEPDSDED
jgi:rubrerythrin